MSRQLRRIVRGTRRTWRSIPRPVRQSLKKAASSIAFSLGASAVGLTNQSMIRKWGHKAIDAGLIGFGPRKQYVYIRPKRKPRKKYRY